MKNLLSIFRFRIFAVTAILLISISSVFAQQKIAIIDAGSSGSRLYVYDFKQDGKEVNVLYDKKIDIPLSKVENSNDSIEAYMDTMTKLYSPTDSIDLYVLATAGMRKVNEIIANDIYKKIESTRPEAKFRIKRAMTISGRYEGLYAWIAANYDIVKEKDFSKEKLSSMRGVLEIGGASMQIAFATHPDSIPIPNSIHREGIGNIYSVSFLNGGVDAIYDTISVRRSIKYEDILKDLNQLTNIPTKNFYGLGKPIENALNVIKNNKDVGSYAQTQPEDSKENFHPISNAYYVKWLLDTLKLDPRKIEIPKKEASWTKGAVYDIVINKKTPECFDYKDPK